MALQVFKSARAKIEATRGASGTPTRILTFTEGSWTQEVSTISPDEYRGSYFGRYSADAGTETNSLSLSGDLTYSQAAWLGYMFVSGAPTLGTPSAGSAYSYAFTPSGSSDDLKTAVVEWGYNDTASSTALARLTYLGGESLTLAWDKAASRVSYDGAFTSASTATKLTAFTGTPTTPTSTLLSTSTTTVYIDTTTIGTTADSNVTSVSWTLTNGWVPLMTLNGTRAAQAVYRPNLRSWEATITRYYATATEQSAFEAKTPRKIRITTTGAALGTATYSSILDLYGVITARSVAEADGLAVETLTLSNLYDTTATTDFKWTVVAADSSIT